MISLNIKDNQLNTGYMDTTNSDFEEELKQAVERRTRVSVGRYRV